MNSPIGYGDPYRVYTGTLSSRWLPVLPPMLSTAGLAAGHALAGASPSVPVAGLGYDKPMSDNTNPPREAVRLGLEAVAGFLLKRFIDAVRNKQTHSSPA